ncbi:Small, acid-soluble spore protein beta [compost metagenome]
MAKDNNRNEYVATEENAVGSLKVDNTMQQFKTEVAAELGLAGYDQMDKGWLASRQNGYVGGNMTKKMVGYSQMAIAQQGVQQIVNATQGIVEIKPEVRRMNELASQNFQGYVKAIQTGDLSSFAQQNTAGQIQ